jgi:hypothetical protein
MWTTNITPIINQHGIIVKSYRTGIKKSPGKGDLYTVKNGVVLIAFSFFPGFVCFCCENFSGDK